MRLIDADKLQKAIYEHKKGKKRIKKHKVVKMIKEQPTVDAVPIEFHELCMESLIKKKMALEKHGRWEDENMDEQVIARCSVCNTWDTMRTPYCPNCGAKMDEE